MSNTIIGYSVYNLLTCEIVASFSARTSRAEARDLAFAAARELNRAAGNTNHTARPVTG